MRDGFARIREELGVPLTYPADAVAEALAESRQSFAALPDMTALELVTIDPPSSMDLDQAVFIERRAGGGYRVWYAIADVPAFVRDGGALDAETRRRGVTLYSPDQNTPLHPVELSEGEASLLPGVDRPALLWCVDLDDAGSIESGEVRRARVRSRSKLSYSEVGMAIDAGTAVPSLMLLREVGQLRQRQEQLRGGISLNLPAQEVAAAGNGYDLRFVTSEPVEQWNAQISLLTGMVAAQIMLDAGIGVLRTMPAPGGRELSAVRRTAKALGIDWRKGEPYPDLIRRMDPTIPEQAAFLTACTQLLKGAGYTAFDGTLPELTTHSAVAAPYAHVTAPLRRLVDRFGLGVCAAVCAGEEVPGSVRAALPELPALMAEADRRARTLERANFNLVEAVMLQDRVGESFAAVVIDDRNDYQLVQLMHPAVIDRVSGEQDLPLGAWVAVRLVEADPERRVVRFEGIGPIEDPRG